MPTTTSAGMLSLNNLGSLTTTFVAPTACSTALGFIRSGLADPRLDVNLIQPVGNCEAPWDFPESCLPHGDGISKQWDDLEQNELRTVLNYYSPGLHCPRGWATVGVYAPNQHSDNATTGAAGDDLGVFSPTGFFNGQPGESTSFPRADFYANMLTSALAPTETAVVCCPSGFSIDPYAGCYSHYPASSLADGTGCYQMLTGTGGGVSQVRFTYTYEFWGHTTTVTPWSVEVSRISDQRTTVTVSFDGSGWPLDEGEFLAPRPTATEDADASNLKGIAAVAPLYLVHGSEDGGDGDDDDNEAEDGDADGDEDDDDNASGRLSPVAGVLAARAFSVAAGLGLLIAW